ncbi:MAG TPA: hypothetical protein VLG27_03760, partial [Candidatus Saccharimonadia bacterium]|nr:hypothetical protein [Candidatus Saccharimonadia bacterium]
MSVGEIQNTPSAADSSNEFARLVEEERIARVLSGEVVASIGHTSMATSEEVSTSETLEPHVALVHYPADKEGNVQTAIEINGHYGSQLDLSEYVDFESDDWRIIFETAKGSEYWCARPAIDNRPGYLVEFGQSRKNDRLEGFYLSKGEKLAPFSFRNKKMTVTATDGIGPVAKVTVLGKEYPADETPEFEEGTLREDFIFLTLWQNLNVWEHKAAYAEWEKQEQ